MNKGVSRRSAGREGIALEGPAMVYVKDAEAGSDTGLLESNFPVAETVQRLLHAWWECAEPYCLVVYDGKTPVCALLGTEPEEDLERCVSGVVVVWLNPTDRTSPGAAV